MSLGASDEVIRLVLVGGHTLFREGLREILAAEPGLTVVGEAGDDARAVQVVTRTQPEVTLLDVGLPGHGAVLTVRRLLAAAPSTRVITVSGVDDARVVQALLAEGVRGYLAKTVTRQDLVSAVRAVVSDGERVVLSVPRTSLSQVPGAPVPRLLSAREREVMTLVAQGMTNAQIARRLQITEGTVKHHLRKVFAKLGATSRLDAVNKAAAASLIDRRAPDG